MSRLQMSSASTKWSSLILPSRILIRLTTSLRFRRMGRRWCCGILWNFVWRLERGWPSRGSLPCARFLNGRIDLTQAEAVRDLIDSQTLYQAKVAAQQLEGALSRRLQPIKQKLVELIAVLEAGIDFAEDDVSVMPDATILDAHC